MLRLNHHKVRMAAHHQIQHNGCQQNAPGPNLLRTRRQAVKIRPVRANVKALLQNKAQVVAILGSVLGFLGILIGIVGLLPSFRGAKYGEVSVRLTEESLKVDKWQAKVAFREWCQHERVCL